MAIIPQLIARYALILYVLFALGALFYVWAALQARRREDIALFAIERDDAGNRARRSWLMAVVCVLLAAGVYSISSFIAPTLAMEQAAETPPIALLFTSTAPPKPTSTLPAAATPTATSAPVATVVPIVTPLSSPPDTPTPEATAEGEEVMPQNAACTSAGTQILAPSNGDQLSGVVEIKGTASLPDFAFYKFEIQWPNSDEWVTLESFDVPVAGGTLGYWDTAPLAGQPGTYRFRLVVVDQTGNYPDPCTISVVIGTPPSEPTASQ